MLRILILVLIILQLNGCASTSTYIPPQPQEEAVSLKGYRKANGLFNWREAHVVSIDDKDVSYTQENLIGGYKGNKVIKVTPGQHTFVINAIFNREFMGSGPFETFLEITTTLLANHNYHLNLEIHGATISTWLEDQSGHRVSEVSSNNYRSVPRRTTIFVPVSR